MNHPLQCRCGTIKGYVVRPGMAKRAVCYCKDCQAFAHFLKRADTVLDEHGGTAIVATVPKQVHFTQGLEALACMSLSDHGLIHWYASCCNTPIGNTPRDFKTPYVGLIESCPKIDWSTCPAVERDPDRVSGAWVFRGTRVPVSALFENLEDGAVALQFVDWFPGVTLEQVRAVLDHAARSALATA